MASGPSVAIASSVAASAGWPKVAPSVSADPPGKNTDAMPGSAARVGSPASVSARLGATGAPSLAYRCARSNAVCQSSTAPWSWSARQPATAPGTVTVCGPRTGIAWPPVSPRTRSASAPAGARPLEFTAVTAPSGRWTRAKRSPPTPHMCGYTTASVVAAARAASIAFPPRSNASAPASVASACGVAIAQRDPAAVVSITLESGRRGTTMPSAGGRRSARPGSASRSGGRDGRLARTRRAPRARSDVARGS